MPKKEQAENKIPISTRISPRDLAIGIKVLKERYGIIPSSKSYTITLIIKAFAAINNNLVEDKFFSKTSEKEYEEFLKDFFSKEITF